MAGFGLFKRLVGGGDRRHHVPRVRAAASTRVLVVDDSATIRAVLGKMLNQDGYEVLKADDGASALALARSERLDLVFLDIVMPGVSGFEVLRTLRREQATAHVPIVMISGNVQATEQFYVQRYGADDFMKKPFGREEVFERIRQLVQAGRLPARVETAPVFAPDEEVVVPPGGVSQDEWDAIPDIALPDAAYGEHKPHDLHGLHELHAAVSAPAQHMPEPVATAMPAAHEAHAVPAPRGLDGVVPPPVHEFHAARETPVVDSLVPPAPPLAPEAHAMREPQPALGAHALPVAPAPHGDAQPQPVPSPASLPGLPVAAVPSAPPVASVVAAAATVPVAPTPVPVAPAHASTTTGSPAHSALAWLASRARVLAPSHVKAAEPPVGEAHPAEATHASRADGTPPKDGA